MPSTKASIVVSVFSLLVLITGGIFVSMYWKTAVYYPQNFKEQTIKNQEETNKNNSMIAVKESAIEKSRHVKGIYLNEHIANSQSANAVSIRENIDSLLKDTELNAVVIDIKESDGPYLPSSLKDYIKKLKENNVWVIARICVFRDASLLEKFPEWYIWNKTATGTLEIWQDNGGGYWLDPKNTGVQDYMINFSKKAIDFGFDELQFDYIRFPSDGDMTNIIYPFYDSSQEKKYEVIGDFFLKISKSLKDYNSDIVLSADLFGYVAAYQNAFEIGQRTYDAAQAFDFISYMLYPSHFYSGFQASKDEKRGLPSIYLPYKSDNIDEVVSNNPYPVIARSIFMASDYISSIDSDVRIRPWLQDFNINKDTERGIQYDVQKIKEQILAAEESGASGWLLWNPSGIYTKEALRSE